MSEKEHIAELKRKYLEYYEDVPVQKYAAMYVGRTDDTIIEWRKRDPEFSEAVDQAKSKWIRGRVKDVKSEFALERLEKQLFGANLDVTTNGKDLPIPIMGGLSVQQNQSDNEDIQPDETV